MNTKIGIIALIMVVVLGGLYAVLSRDKVLPASDVVLTRDADHNASWSQVGTIVKNNPGMKPDIWHLVYEQPGKPALTKELLFTPSSMCIAETTSTCVPEVMEIGMRAHVDGDPVSDDVIRVQNIEFLP